MKDCTVHLAVLAIAALGAFSLIGSVVLTMSGHSEPSSLAMVTSAAVAGLCGLLPGAKVPNSDA